MLLDGADRAAEGGGDLRLGKVGEIAHGHDLALASAEPKQNGHQLGALDDDGADRRRSGRRMHSSTGPVTATHFAQRRLVTTLEIQASS